MARIIALYNEEKEKLKDPSYPGGGYNPPFGPSVTANQIMNKHFKFSDFRMRYCKLLMEEHKRLEYSFLEELSKMNLIKPIKANFD